MSVTTIVKVDFEFIIRYHPRMKHSYETISLVSEKGTFFSLDVMHHPTCEFSPEIVEPIEIEW